MPVLTCYVDPETLAGLEAAAAEDGGGTATDLAEAAIAEAVLDWRRSRPLTAPHLAELRRALEAGQAQQVAR